MPKIYKERRVYFFACEICGKGNRHSYKRRKAKNKICRPCIKAQPDPNQQALFELPKGAIKSAEKLIKEVEKMKV